MKNPNLKTRWHLLPWEILDLVVEAFEEGAEKYGKGTWAEQPHGDTTYFDAAMRHLIAAKTQRLTSEQQTAHLARAIASIMIWTWHAEHRDPPTSRTSPSRAKV